MAGAAGEPPQKREEWGDYRENGARGRRRAAATQMASEHSISSHYSPVCRLSGLRAQGGLCSGQLILASYRMGWKYGCGNGGPQVLGEANNECLCVSAAFRLLSLRRWSLFMTVSTQTFIYFINNDKEKRLKMTRQHCGSSSGFSGQNLRGPWR